MFGEKNQQDWVQRFLFIGCFRAVVYAKLAAIEMILGIMGRVPAAVDGLHGLHLCVTHLGLRAGSRSWSLCTLYRAGWGPSQEVDGPIDLVQPMRRLRA